MFTYSVGTLNPKVGGIPRNGLIGEWLFTGNPNDTSGSGNDAQLGDGVTPSTYPTLTTDRKSVSNSAYSYNLANSQYMELGDLYDIGTGDFSISIWVNHNNLTGNQGLVGKSRAGSTNGRWSISMNGSNFIALLNHSVGTVLITTPASIGWHNLILVMDRTGNMSLYEDNVFKSSTDISFFSGANLQNILINRFGCFNDAGGNPANYLNGKLDDILFYDKVLTADDRTAIFTA